MSEIEEIKVIDKIKSLSTNDEDVCNFAVLAYELDKIIEEFEIKVYANDKNNLDTICLKINIIHNQVKIMKNALANSQRDFDHQRYLNRNYKKKLLKLSRIIDSEPESDYDSDNIEESEILEEPYDIINNNINNTNTNNNNNNNNNLDNLDNVFNESIFKKNNKYEY